MKLYQLLLVWLLNFSTICAGDLLNAVWDHDLEKIKNILKKDPESVNDKDSKGVTALMYATSDGDIDTVKVLIDAQAHINAQDNQGNTALMYYALNKVKYAIHHEEGQAIAIKDLLLKAGADQVLKNKDGKTWQDLEKASALNMERGAVQRAFDLKKVTDTALGLKKLIEAIREKNIIEVREIITDMPGIIHEPDAGGMTPLMHAAGHLDSLRPYAEDANLSIIHMLVDAGAKLNVQDDQGRTALFIAAENKRPAVIKLLKSMGADVDISDYAGNTPLMVAQYENVINYLIAAEAKINLQNKVGETALMRAVLRNSMPAVIALLKAGADATLKNKEGKTALDLAKIAKNRRSNVDSEIESILKMSSKL